MVCFLCLTGQARRTYVRSSDKLEPTPRTLLNELKRVVEVEVPCPFVPEFPIPAKVSEPKLIEGGRTPPRSDRVRKEILHEETCG